jgi:hypothetical protein
MDYKLDDQKTGVQYQWGPSRPSVGPKQPPVQWIMELYCFRVMELYCFRVMELYCFRVMELYCFRVIELYCFRVIELY